MENKEIQCEAEIRKNIVLVECGRELTLPLTRLKQDCRFREAWDKWNEKEIKEEVKAKQKEYFQRPEIKAKRKEYHKEYYQKNREEILNKLHRNSISHKTSNKKEVKKKW